MKLKADVAVDIECDPKLLQKVMGMLKREVDSVNIAPTGSAQELSEANKDDNVPFTPISTVSFGTVKFFCNFRTFSLNVT